MFVKGELKWMASALKIRSDRQLETISEKEVFGLIWRRFMWDLGRAISRHTNLDVPPNRGMTAEEHGEEHRIFEEERKATYA